MAISRRRILRNTVCAGLAGGFGPNGPKCVAEETAQDNGAPPRKAFSRLKKNELEFLRTVYNKWAKVPKERPFSQECHRLIHSNHCGGSSSGGVHGSWHFLPWHRCFVHFHERALIAVAGMSSIPGFPILRVPPGFRLPYWDWDRTHCLPPQLSDASWLLGTTHDASARYDTYTSDAAIGALLSATKFEGVDGFGGSSGEQGGASSSTVHSKIHAIVSDIMKNPDTAAQDPLFFLHHANMDRMWEIWARSQGKTVSTYPYSSEFYELGELYRFPGARFDYSPRSCLSTKRFGYRYDSYETTVHFQGEPTPLPVQPPQEGVSSLTSAARDLLRELIAAAPASSLRSMMDSIMNALSAHLVIYLTLAGARPAQHGKDYTFFLQPTQAGKPAVLLGGVTPFVSDHHADGTKINATFAVDPERLLDLAGGFSVTYEPSASAMTADGAKRVPYDQIYLTARIFIGQRQGG